MPYAYSGNQWIGYEDIESISLKADYINDLNLGGAMVWSLETDDFHGICGQGEYPLIKTVRRVLLNGWNSDDEPTTTSAPTETTDSTSTDVTPTNGWSTESNTHNTSPETTTILASGIPVITTTTGIVDQSTTTTDWTDWTTAAITTTRRPATTPTPGCVADIYRDPENCAAFYKCDHGTAYHFACPAPLLFDNITTTCNWAKYVQC